MSSKDDQVLEVLRAAFQAARSGDQTQLAAFLAAGVKPDLQNDKGDSLLMLASYHGHAECARLLLERGASADRTNDRGQTPLAGACFKGDLAMATLLLDHGAAVDFAGPDGKTALMYAAMFDRVELVSLLIARGAQPTRLDGMGLSAVQLARAMGAPRTAAQLSALASA